MPSLFRVLQKLGFYIEKYDTYIDVGIKCQMDVKYVPKECYSGTTPDKFYQYTIIDEATRARFIYPYKEKSSFSTIYFVKRAIVYFGHQPKIIQTDNGSEFTYISKTNETHLLDILLNILNIPTSLLDRVIPDIMVK